jgi:hypothetical protein
MRFFVAVIASGLLLAGCSEGDNTAQSVPTATVTTPPPSPTPKRVTPTPTKATRNATTPPTGPLRLTKGMTRPGARLRFGQKAIVPIRQYNSFPGTYTEGVLGVVVQKIQRAPGSKVEGNFDAKSTALLKSHTAYYAKIVITNESGNAMSSLIEPRFDPVRRGGQQPDLALIGGDLPGCRTTSSPDTFDHKGAQWVTCEVGASSPSRPIREIRYDAPPYGTEIQTWDDDPAPKFNQYYDLGAITWH